MTLPTAHTPYSITTVSGGQHHQRPRNTMASHRIARWGSGYSAGSTSNREERQPKTLVGIDRSIDRSIYRWIHGPNAGHPTPSATRTATTATGKGTGTEKDQQHNSTAV